MKEIQKQEKFGFDVKVGPRGAHRDLNGTYGPFDTAEAADKTRKALVAAGLTVSDVRTIWTVSTARSIATVLAPKKEQPEAEAADAS